MNAFTPQPETQTPETDLDRKLKDMLLKLVEHTLQSNPADAPPPRE